MKLTLCRVEENHIVPSAGDAVPLGPAKTRAVEAPKVYSKRLGEAQFKTTADGKQIYAPSQADQLAANVAKNSNPGSGLTREDPAVVKGYDTSEIGLCVGDWVEVLQTKNIRGEEGGASEAGFKGKRGYVERIGVWPQIVTVCFAINATESVPISCWLRNLRKVERLATPTISTDKTGTFQQECRQPLGPERLFRG